MSENFDGDELAIRALVAAYSDAANRGDVQGMVDVYIPDGVLVPFGGAECIGHDNLRATFAQVFSVFSWIFQMTHNGLVKVDGDTAIGRFWVSEWAGRADGRGSQFMGLYQDRYVRTHQGWRFARRQLDMTFKGHVTFDGKVAPRPVYVNGLWD